MQNPAASYSKNCPKQYTRADAKRPFRRAFDGRNRATRGERKTLKRVIRCQRHAGVRRDLRVKRRQARIRHVARRKAWEAQNYWRFQWEALSPADRAWAIRTGACESGNDPTINTGNGYLGAHQWLPSTWGRAVAMFGGGSPSTPTAASYHQQAVVAVRWRNYAGAGQWPKCG